MIFIPIMTDAAEKATKEYQEKLDKMDAQQLIQEFFTYLDYTEETDSGREFHPITISSCRVALSPAMSMLLEKMRNYRGF